MKEKKVFNTCRGFRDRKPGAPRSAHCLGPRSSESLKGSPWVVGGGAEAWRMGSRGTTLPQGCSSDPQAHIHCHPCNAHTQAGAHRRRTHWHTLRHAAAHGPSVPAQTYSVAGTQIPTRDHRADFPSSLSWILPLCLILALSHCQPWASLSPEPSTCPVNTRTLVFSPSDPAVSLFLKNQALPPWPPTLSLASLAQDHLQGPKTTQCSVPLEEEALES